LAARLASLDAWPGDAVKAQSRQQWQICLVFHIQRDNRHADGVGDTAKAFEGFLIKAATARSRG